MSQQGVVVDFTFGVKANQHFQLAAESHGLGFNSRTHHIITVLSRINNEIDILLAVFLAEDRIAFRHRVVRKFRKNFFQGLVQRLGVRLGDRPFRQFVHISQQRDGDSSHSRQHQQHIFQR